MKNSFLGNWRITEMEEWDKEYIDLVVPGYIKFDKKGMGAFQFGTVEGGIDWRLEENEKTERIEFSWEGNNDTDSACGRGWAIKKGGNLNGRLYIHLGDDSGFTAIRQK